MKRLRTGKYSKTEIEKITFLENLEGVLEAEHYLGRCCQHLALLIRNGSVRAKCGQFSLAAKEAEAKLQAIFEREGVDFKVEYRCEFCHLKPDNFSLEGAISLSLEIVEAAINYYRNIVRLSKASSRPLFVELLKSKLVCRRSLLGEKKFDRNRAKGNVIDDFCMPHIISPLWR